MSKFKVGDKVRRIEVPNRSSSAQSVQWELPVGHVDTITHIDECWLRLAGYPQHDAQHDEEKFELAETPFKVGDRVVVINNKDNESWFDVGDVGVVVGVDQHYHINFDAQGNKQVVDDGRWYVDRCDLTLAPPRYSSTFANPVAKAEPTTGHSESGGLQKHSIGDIYPLAVVGYGDSPMIYVLENLETGQVAGCESDYSVRQWPNKVSYVYDFAKKYGLPSKEAKIDEGGDEIIWLTGRPVNHLGRLVMPKLKRTVQV